MKMLDDSRQEFVSNVSHELKTPIALIQGYAEGLQDNINDDEESRQFYCDVIIDEAGKMNQMVKKLLTLNQLEFGNDQVNMERFDLTSLIQGVIQSSQILAQQAEVEIMFHQTEPLHVWGDEFKVEEVITNYVTNAIHYAKNEKKIDIRCTQENGVIRTSVFNTGDAIPEEELATFEEAGACGTAAVISPIERIDDLENGKSYVISKDGKPGPICTKLYNKLRGIQYGDEPDTHGWVTIVE